MGFLIKVIGKKIEDIKVFLETAVDHIIEGKLIAFPTNSVYGIGGDPQNLNLIEKLYNIKFRDKSKGFLLLISDIDEAYKIAEFNETAKILAEHFWPGQLTLILKKKSPNIIPSELTANRDTIGLRVPENPIILEILKILKSRGYFGGIIGTSANFSGEKPSISGIEVAKIFIGILDLIIDAGKSKTKIPSTIVDCSEDKIKILRIGKITKEEIIKIISENHYNQNEG
ncbi:MAG: L-threonylcarbamoyladenylate synthase [Promethearchaeota archaeon]